MKLYSVTIRGIKYYFEAQISDEQYKLVNKMCETIQEESQKYCAEDIFSLFTNRILTETNSGPGLLPVLVSNDYNICHDYCASYKSTLKTFL